MQVVESGQWHIGVVSGRLQFEQMKTGSRSDFILFGLFCGAAGIPILGREASHFCHHSEPPKDFYQKLPDSYSSIIVAICSTRVYKEGSGGRPGLLPQLIRVPKIIRLPLA